MTSSVPGLISQMTGFHTSEKCHHSSSFVDDKTDFKFFYPQKRTSVDEIILAQKAYEVGLRKYGEIF